MMYGMQTKTPGTMLEKTLDKVNGPEISAQIGAAASGILTTVQDELHSVEQRVSILDPNILLHVAIGLAALEGCKMAWHYVWSPKDSIYDHADEVLNPDLKKSVDNALSNLPTIDTVATKDDVNVKLDVVKKHVATLAATHGKLHEAAAKEIAALKQRLGTVEGNVTTTMKDVVALKAAELKNSQGLLAVSAILHGTDKQAGLVKRYDDSTSTLTAKVVALEELSSKVDGRLKTVEKMDSNVTNLQTHSINVDKKLAEHEGKFTEHDATHKRLDGNIKKVAAASKVDLNENKGGILSMLGLGKKDQQQQQQQSNNNNAGAGSSKDSDKDKTAK
jgi:hypothetical protein